MPVQITGVSNVLKAIGKQKSGDAINIQEALTKCGEVLMKKCLTVVPRDTNALANSHRVVVTGKGLHTRVTVEAGGPSAPYALWVHEDMTKKHAPPTMAQWITKSVKAVRGTMASIVRREIQSSPTKTIEGEEVK